MNPTTVQILRPDAVADLFRALRQHIGAVRVATPFPDLQRDLDAAGRLLTDVQSSLDDVAEAAEEYRSAFGGES